MINMKGVFLWFEATSGLRVNGGKTKLYKVGQVINWEELIDTWCCCEGKFPDSYLGLPLGAKFKCTAVWTELLEKFRKRLALWKKRFLTKAGRLILIKTTLAALPVFFLSLFVVPCSVADTMERIIRNFLWGSGEEKKQFHLLNWEQLCEFRMGRTGFAQDQRDE